MTVAVEPIDVVVVGPQQDGIYAFAFDWRGGDQLSVTLYASESLLPERVLAHGAEWTATPDVRATGGQVTLLADPGDYTRLRIRRETTVAQEFVAPPTAAGFESALDRVVMQQQENAAAIDRAVTSPDGETDLRLPPYDPGALLAWSADASELTTVDPEDLPYDIPVESVAGLTGAIEAEPLRAAMGLGSAATRSMGLGDTEIRSNLQNDGRFLNTSDNLSDIANAAAARANLGIAAATSVSAGFMPAGDKAKVDLIAVTASVDLDALAGDVAALGGGVVFKGNWDASGGSFPGAGAAQTGWMYSVQTGGTVDGVTFTAGETLIAIADDASTTTFAGNWSQQGASAAVLSVAGLTGSILAGDLSTALGLGTAATTDATDYATAAQGARADTAVQPGDLLDDVTTALGLGTASTRNMGTGDAEIRSNLQNDGRYLNVSDNLSDIANVATARASLGLGTAATTAAADYATAAQGALADTALQSDDLPGEATNVSAGFMPAGDKAKVDLIAVTASVDLDALAGDVAALGGGVVFKGNWDASGGSFPGAGAAQTGWMYSVQTGGTVDGVTFTAGETLIAIADDASTTTFAGNWSQQGALAAVLSVAGLTGSILAGDLSTALGLGTAAERDMGTGDTEIRSNLQNDGRYLTVSDNLSDIANVATARTNLGLGDLAVEDGPLSQALGGTGAATLAAGGLIPTGGDTAVSLAALTGRVLPAAAFGVVANSRGAAGDNAAALQAAIDYCAANDVALDLGAGTIFVQGRLTIDTRMHVFGRGAGEWSKFPAFVSTAGKDPAPSQLVFTGTGARDIKLYGVTSMQASGAAWPNPSARAGMNESVYRMQSFATGSGAAPSLQQFSAAIHVIGAGAAGTVLRDFRILPDHGGDHGLDGYLNAAGGWSAGDYDCGVYQDGGERVLYRHLHRVGHWRRSGYLLSCAANNVDGYANGWQPPYYTRHEGCVDEGWKSVSIRGTDSFAIVNVTATYVEVPWADDHPFVTGISGYNNVQLGAHFLDATKFTLTSAPKVTIAGEPRVRLNLSTNPSGTVAIGDSAHPRTVGGGSSHIHFVDCVQHGMVHPSGYECHDTAIIGPYAAPDTPIEVSGWRMVEIVFQRNAMQFRGPVAMHLHNVWKLQMYGCFFEKNPSRSAGASSAYRMIAAPAHDDNPNVAAGRGAGETRSAYFDAVDAIQTIAGMDIRPYGHVPASQLGEFDDAGETGMFRPQWGVLEQALRMSGMEEGHILRAPSERRVGFAAADFEPEPGVTGDLRLRFWYDDATDRVVANAHLEANNAAIDVGTAGAPFRTGRFASLAFGALTVTTGAGSPEGAVTAPVGSLYLRTDGAADTTLWVKQTGTGSTGWAAK